MQRTLAIDDDPAVTPPLTGVVERLMTGSPTVASFIQRAKDSKQTYRLRWAAASEKETVELRDGEIVIAIRRGQFGEFVWTPDEIVAEKVIDAVTRFDPSAQMAATPVPKEDELQLPDMTEDVLLSTPLRKGNRSEYRKRTEGFSETRLAHLTPVGRRLVVVAIAQAEGVPLSEIIRGVETNTPFRTRQEIDGDRVRARYVDPRLLPADAEKLDLAAFYALLPNISREVTFVLGADEATAPGAPLPKSGTPCSADEQRDSDNSCCTAEMLLEIAQHLNTARAAVERTIERLEGNEIIDSEVSDHFDGASEATLARIASMLRVAKSELFMSRHGWKCRPRSSGMLDCRAESGGYVGGAVVRGSRDILLCMDSSAPFSTWTSVLHEVMHRVGVHGTEIYRFQAGYPGPNPLTNADSYAGLVDALGSENWTPHLSTPADFRAISGAGSSSGFMLGARMELTPFGPGLRVVDWTVGANFLWSPKSGILAGHGDDSSKLLAKGYLGADTGVRVTVPREHGMLVFDAVAGIGMIDPTQTRSATAMGRVGGRWRFGTALSGAETGVELSRLQGLAQAAGGEWVIGVSFGYHFGKPEKRK
ncbi:MAG TPA: hypothetical protein VJZ00_07550 [Thermoanaerobaculia bacterium]|nr:hypothetical protein [Thermoanaerobaculia bacterium]